MADPKAVAKKDGAFKTNAVQVEAHHVAPDYKLRVLDQNKIDPTGRLKVLRLSPSSEQAADPCFVGRWDEKANALDFDATDRGDDVDKNARFTGHHSKALGDRRFEVEISTEANKLVFKGIVSVALGFNIHLGDLLTVADLKFDAEFVRETAPEPDSGDDRRGHD